MMHDGLLTAGSDRLRPPPVPPRRPQHHVLAIAVTLVVAAAARYFDIHPANPQRRAIVQIAGIVRAGGVIAYPTDSCYALGCQLGNKDGITRIRSIRHLDDRHHLTLVCQDFAQLGQFVYVANPVFRAIKAAAYTFMTPRQLYIHPARDQGGAAQAAAPGEEDRRGADPRHVVTQALLAELGEPLVLWWDTGPCSRTPPGRGRFARVGRVLPLVPHDVLLISGDARRERVGTADPLKLR